MVYCVHRATALIHEQFRIIWDKALKRLGGGRYCFNCGHRIGLGGRFVGKHRFCNRCADMVEGEEASDED